MPIDREELFGGFASVVAHFPTLRRRRERTKNIAGEKKPRAGGPDAGRTRLVEYVGRGATLHTLRLLQLMPIRHKC